MMDERKNKKTYVTYAAVIIALVLVCGGVFYLKIQKDKEDQKARERYKEKVMLQVKADEKAEKYVQEYAADLQSDMCQSGLDDIKVDYRECSSELFHNFFEIKADEDADYMYYYVLEFGSDQMNQLYKTNVQNGDLAPFIQTMDEERKVKNSLYDSTYHKQRITMDNQTIVVYIADDCKDFGIIIEGEDGVSYKLYQDDTKTRLYINEKEVDTELPKEKDSTSDSETSRGGMPNLHGDSSTADSTGDSSSGSGSSGRRNDPYDVYDYDDPDDFADEWAEEFGDGDYDDGYDDAYAYWEEAWGWW